MQEKKQSLEAVQSTDCHEDVVLNLSISGTHEQILSLLEQMGAVSGFSVLKGSFIVSTSRNSRT